MVKNLALANIGPWSVVPFFSISFERTANSKPPTIPFGIAECAFSDSLSRNSCIQIASQAWVSLSFAPLGKKRIARRTAARSYFVVTNKGAGSSIWVLMQGDLQNQYLFWFGSNVQQTMYVKAVLAETARRYFQTVEEQVIRLQSKVQSNL